MHPSASSNSLKANTRLHKTRTLQANSSSSELHSTCVELVLVLAQRALPSRARSGVLWEYRLFCGVLFCWLSSHPSLGESRSMKGEANPADQNCAQEPSFWMRWTSSSKYSETPHTPTDNRATNFAHATRQSPHARVRQRSKAPDQSSHTSDRVLSTALMAGCARGRSRRHQ
jgi:hypothetical protein